MLRSLAAIIAGQLSITFLNGFTRLVIALYHRGDLRWSGVSHLPSPSWQYGMIILAGVFGIFGGLVTCSVARKGYHTEILVLISLVIISGLFSYQLLNPDQPTWYLVAEPLAIVAGVWLGYRISRAQEKAQAS